MGNSSSIFRKLTIQNTPLPATPSNPNSQTDVLEAVQNLDLTSKFNDPVNFLPRYSIEEIKSISDSFVASSPNEEVVNYHVIVYYIY